MSDPLSTLGHVSTHGEPGLKPHTLEVARELAAEFPQVTRFWGFNPDPPGPKANSEHYSGRALDVMTYSDKALGRAVWSYAWLHRQRLGLQHEIFDEQIRSTTVAPGDIRLSGDHEDHVHLFFLARPPKYRPLHAGPPKASRITFNAAPADKSWNTVKLGQRALDAVLGRSLTADGYRGRQTIAAIKAWQLRCKGKPTGRLTWSQWKRLAAKSGVFAAVVEVSLGTFNRGAARYASGDQRNPWKTVQLGQTALALALDLDLDADGYFGPKTVEAVRQWQRKAGGRSDGRLIWQQWKRLSNADDVFTAKR